MAGPRQPAATIRRLQQRLAIVEPVYHAAVALHRNRAKETSEDTERVMRAVARALDAARHIAEGGRWRLAPLATSPLDVYTESPLLERRQREDRAHRVGQPRYSAWCPDIEDEIAARDYVGATPMDIAEQHAAHVYVRGWREACCAIRVRAICGGKRREWDVTVNVELSCEAGLVFPRAPEDGCPKT